MSRGINSYASVVAVPLAGVVTAGAGSVDLAGKRLVPAVVRRLEEHRLPELVVAAGAGDPDVSPAAAVRGPLATIAARTPRARRSRPAAEKPFILMASDAFISVHNVVK